MSVISLSFTFFSWIPSGSSHRSIFADQMNECWHQLVGIFWSGSNFQGAVFLVGMGAVTGLLVGALLVAVAGIRAFVRGFKVGLAKDRSRRLAKHILTSDDSHNPLPVSDAPPVSDI